MYSSFIIFCVKHFFDILSFGMDRLKTFILLLFVNNIARYHKNYYQKAKNIEIHCVFKIKFKIKLRDLLSFADDKASWVVSYAIDSFEGYRQSPRVACDICSWESL